MIVEGLDELDANVRRLQQILPESTELGVARGIVKMVAGIRRQTPIGETRETLRSIGGTVRKYKFSVHGRAGINVTKRVRRADGSGGRGAPYAHIVATGSKPRRTKNGANRGAMPSNDFVGRAFKATVGSAKTTFTRTVLSDIAAFQ